jgi:cytochrome b561
MADTAANQRYTTIAILLHWATAFFIFNNLLFGFFMEDYPDAKRLPAVFFHISCGMSVLALVVLRLIWRATHKPPAFPSVMTRGESKLAHAVHHSIYLLMFVLPITGWLFLSANPPGRPGPPIFGLFSLPKFDFMANILPQPRQKEIHDALVEVHEIAAWILIGLLVLHVLGALKHQFKDRVPELARMGLGRMPRGQG